MCCKTFEILLNLQNCSYFLLIKFPFRVSAQQKLSSNTCLNIKKAMLEICTPHIQLFFKPTTHSLR
jgi:hypothetical protein